MLRWTLGQFALAVSVATFSDGCQGGKPMILVGAKAQHAEFTAHTDASVDSTITNVVGIDAGCIDAEIRGQLRPSNLLIILDRSGSMACNLPEDGQSSADCAQFPLRRFPDRPSKWELTIAALDSALSTLRVTNRVRVALSVFPESGSACTIRQEPQVPFLFLDTKAQKTIDDTLAPLTPQGNTPLVGATILGYQYLLDQIRKNSLDGENFVVLLTDGQETCRTDEIPKLTTTDAPNAFQLLGIRTFAIGVPGSEDAREFLSELAEAGGTLRSNDCHYGPGSSDGNCHFDMTTSDSFSLDLLDALSKINAEILSCSFSIPETTGGASVDLSRVNIKLNQRDIQFVPNRPCAEGTDGWQYTPGNTSIRLCGSACIEAQTPGSSVSIVLGCPTYIW